MKWGFVILGILFLVSPAEARHRQVQAQVVQAECWGVCPLVNMVTQPVQYVGRVAKRVAVVAYETGSAIVGHPAGCPSRQFCGCGAAMRIYGRPVRDLWLAANWYKFPRAYPAPGTAAVRQHHVFILEAHISGDVWQVYDANSGGHQTRIHARSIAGYTIVQPS